MKINKGMRYEGWGKSLASTLRTLAMVVAVCLFACGVNAAGFDGMTLVTNSWFDANFTALTANTDITQGSDTGITLGAGSWSSVPDSATAQIVADTEVGEGATLLSIDVYTSDLLTFSPAPFSITSGYETVAVDIKTDPVYELPTLDNNVQGAFLIYMDGEENLSLQGYTDNGWTNLVGATASDLTNVWMKVYTDYATVSNVRYVRYSVKLGDTLTILQDSVGTTWFPSAATSKTALESVSFLGSGKIRTFSGKELQEAVASYNGVNYGTVAAAIAAAEEGGTVTLVKGATEAALSITKDITLDLAEKTTSIPYITIAEGKTLTLKRANKQNQIGYFTGGGNLVVSGNNTFRWDSMTGTTTLASITQENASGGISISGYGTINVSGDVSVKAILTLSPSWAMNYTAGLDTTDAEPYTLKLSAGGKISVGTLNGSGTYAATGGMTVGAGDFNGVIATDTAFTSTGNVTLSGVNKNAGDFTISSGTMTLSSWNYSSIAKFDFDCQNTNNWTFVDDEGALRAKQLKSASDAVPSGQLSYSYFNAYGSVTSTVSRAENVFNGFPYIQMESGMNYSWGNAKSSRAVSVGSMIVYEVSSSQTGDIISEGNNSSHNGYLNINSSGIWASHSNGANNDTRVYVDGIKSTAATFDKMQVVASLARVPTNDNRWDIIGVPSGYGRTQFTGKIGEYIGFSGISYEQYLAVYSAMVNKWNLDNPNNVQGLPYSAQVNLASGATLDLGATTQTVASFTGGGTVQNGTLLTADNVYTNTGALNMPVVADAKVVIGEGATALTLVGDASTMTIEFSDEFIASNGSITITATGLTEESFKNAPSDIFRYGLVDNGDGTWTLGPATTFTAATYTWSPVGNSTDWTSTANWKVGEQSVAVIPQSVDSVVFPATEGDLVNTIELASNVSVVSFAVNGDTRISGASIIVLGTLQSQETNNDNYGTVNITGEGKIYLGENGGVRARQSQYQSETVMINVPEIVIEGTAENPSYLVGHLGSSNKMPTTYVKATSNITGSGYVTIGARRGQWDMTTAQWKDFTGHVIVHDDGLPRDAVRFTTTSDIDSLVGSKWNLADSNTSFIPKNTAYTFGELTGAPYITESGTTVNVGGANTDFTVAGNYGNNATINKQGTGTMTFNGVRVKALGLEAGIVKVTNPRALHYLPYYYKDSKNAKQTGESSTVAQWEEDKASHAEEYTQDATPKYTAITFKGGTLELAAELEDFDFSAQITSAIGAAVKINLPEARTWATALAESNTALVKSGAGTLTLSAAPLADTFEISVEAGKVVVPKTMATNITLAKGTKRTEVGDNYEYEKGDDELATNETEEKTGLADQAAADELAHSYNVTLTDAQTTQGLKANYYKVKATATATAGTYTMSVVLDETEVGVDFGEDEDTVEPVVFTGSAPTFQLKECVKKGLYYSVGTVASPTAAEVTVLAEQQATEDGQEIALTPTSMAFGAGSVIYYKLSVSDTTQVTNN